MTNETEEKHEMNKIKIHSGDHSGIKERSERGGILCAAVQTAMRSVTGQDGAIPTRCERVCWTSGVRVKP